MVSIGSLWLPILLSAVLVFLVSWIVHMFLPFHKNDFRQAPGEGALLDALRKADVPPGDYMLPHAGSMDAMKDPAYIASMERGPVVVMSVAKGAKPSMGGSLGAWFLYSLIVSVIAAYVTGHAVPEGAPYRSVMRFAGCVSFVGYSLALMQNSIWYKRAWRITGLYMADGLLYGLVTGGVFGWLWPR